MASIVLGVAGAVIGSFFGVPGIGWSIGSAIGGQMTSQDTPTVTQEGPRIGDLRVQQSSWGNMIPVIYGVSRVSGNGIWATNFKETKHSQTVSSGSGGGKGGQGGGSKTTQITYTYSVSFAMAICKGPIVGIRRIWANGEVIYNIDSTVSDIATDTASAALASTFHIYTGSETQLPDSWIEADKGIGNVPAYRGMAYIVFNDFQLEKYGNRIPQLEFEVVTAGTISGGKISSSTVPLSYILTDICAIGKVTSVDASNLSDVPIRGYALSRPTSVAQNILPLQKVYLFDIGYTDNTIKFLHRAAVISYNIPFDSLIHDSINIARANENSLLNKVTLEYVNIDTGYNVAVESVVRLISNASQTLTEATTLAINPTEAAQAADTILYLVHIQRNLITFHTTLQYSDLEPLDLVYINTITGKYLVKITKKLVDLGIIKFEGVSEVEEVYTSNAQGNYANNYTADLIISTPVTTLSLMDIPLISPTDDDNYTVYSAFSTDTATNWYGAELLRANISGTFEKIAESRNRSIVGISSTVLSPWIGGNMLDISNSFRVNIGTTGTLSSCTYDNLLLGTNICLLGQEILQFKDAILISPGIYELSNLLRYRRGTEYLSSTTHSIGEQFILCDQSILSNTDNLLYRNTIEYYKGASFGTDIYYANQVSFTNTGNSCRPFAPTQLVGIIQPTQDIQINWVRCARINTEWTNYTEVPLDEPVELYDIEVLNGTSIVRTILSNSLTNYLYTASMQSADFGTNSGNTINIKVYQISSRVGRGIPAITTITT